MVIKAIFHIFCLKFEKKIRIPNLEQQFSKNGIKGIDPSFHHLPKTKQNKMNFQLPLKQIPILYSKAVMPLYNYKKLRNG